MMSKGLMSEALLPVVARSTRVFPSAFVKFCIFSYYSQAKHCTDSAVKALAGVVIAFTSSFVQVEPNPQTVDLAKLEHQLLL